MVQVCDVCGSSYVISHLGDYGVCRLCEMREDGWRRKIAAQVHALGASEAIIEAIRKGPS